MLVSFTTRPRPDPETPWAYGFIFIGPEGSHAMGPQARWISTRLRLLSAGDRSEAILRLFSRAVPGEAFRFESQLRPKLIRLPLTEALIDEGSLAAGRLPNPSGDEVLAGPEVLQRARLMVGVRPLEVVGVLKPDLALFADSYLIPDSGATGNLFPPDDPSVHPATLVRLSPEQFRKRQIKAANPSPGSASVESRERLGRGRFCAYLTGLAGLFMGGSGVLIGFNRWLADRARLRWLAAPLREMQRQPGLLWTVHASYFGLVVLLSLVAYALPEVQIELLTMVRAQIGGSDALLSLAGRAYGSGSILYAAVVTFLINFLLGSVASITLPSMVVPGVGAVSTVIRALMWGVVLAPTFAGLAGPMLLHSWAMLLEGEAYILATFFGLLIPIHLARMGLEGTAPSRFGRVLLLNLQANALVALVLVIAAFYEAAEVIIMYI
jgi:hypothetical protein